MKHKRGLHFDNQAMVDEHVHSVHPQLLAFVYHADTNFPSDMMSPGSEFAFHRHHTNVFQEPEAKLIVSFEERTDDRSGELFVNQSTTHS